MKPAVLLALSFLHTLTLSSPLHPIHPIHPNTLALRQLPCPLPAWSVSNASATYSPNPLEVPGKGSFTLTHLHLNTTEHIFCDLAFNTACRTTGTPVDPLLQWQFQVNIDFSWVVFNRTLDRGWEGGCVGGDGDKRPKYAYGYAEFTMKCPEEVKDDMTCMGLDGAPLVVNGTAWTPPEPEPEVAGR